MEEEVRMLKWDQNAKMRLDWREEIKLGEEIRIKRRDLQNCKRKQNGKMMLEWENKIEWEKKREWEKKIEW